MSGNFDFPPASDSNTAARFDNLSRNLQRDRDDFNSQREAAAAERQHTRTTLTPQTARRRRIASSLSDPRPSNMSPPAYPRPGGPESREHLRRQLDDLDLVSQELQDARRRLETANNHLNDAQRSVVVDHMSQRQRKRRKLDHDTIKQPTGFHTKPYGYFGQVEPGLLRMEIVSCDGGAYVQDSTFMYRAENVLRNDPSVYCTRASQCNLLLRHQDGVMFTIKKITIKAPEQGFTAPLQQGLIFIGYHADELIEGAKPYRIKYEDLPPPPPRPPSHSPIPSVTRDRQNFALLESVHDEHVSQRLSRARPLGQSLPSMREMVQYLNIPRDDGRAAEHRDDDDDDDEACDWPTMQPLPINHTGFTRAPTPPPFTVTAETENEESDDDEIGADAFGIHDNLPPPPPWLQWEARPPVTSSHRNRRSDGWNRHRLYPDDAESSSEDETRWHPGLPDELRLHRPPVPYSRVLSRPARRSTPGRIEPPPPPPPLRGSVVGDAKEGEKLLAPNAKFFIGRQKSCINVTFDTPVSGRFLLLKFFSPQLKERDSEDNIDVQYVAAHGFAGPRFFPSIEMR